MVLDLCQWNWDALASSRDPSMVLTPCERKCLEGFVLVGRALRSAA